MKVDRISTTDINNIGSFGKLVATLPSYAACESAKNLVTRAKARHPRADGLTYTVTIDKSINEITIEVVRPEDVRRKNR